MAIPPRRQSWVGLRDYVNALTLFQGSYVKSEDEAKAIVESLVYYVSCVPAKESHNLLLESYKLTDGKLAKTYNWIRVFRDSQNDYVKSDRMIQYNLAVFVSRKLAKMAEMMEDVEKNPDQEMDNTLKGYVEIICHFIYKLYGGRKSEDIDELPSMMLKLATQYEAAHPLMRDPLQLPFAALNVDPKSFSLLGNVKSGDNWYDVENTALKGM